MGSLAKKLTSRNRKHGRGKTHRRWLLSETLERRDLLTTIVVNTPLDVTLAGDGLTSLREAIVQANSTPDNDTINFDPGVFASAQEIALFTQQLTIANNGSLTINGTGAKLLSINGVNQTRVFHVTAGANVTLSGLTIRNGLSPDSEGGGIRNEGNLTVLESEIKFNRGGGSQQFLYGGGGGIYNIGTLNLINSTVYGNTANKSTQNNSIAVGGGIFNTSGGTANIINSTISSNVATAPVGGSGGGIWNEGINDGASATLHLINSTVAFNVAEGTGEFHDTRGAGINNNGGTLTARNSIIAGNTFNSNRAFAPDYYNELTSEGHNLIGIVTPLFTQIQGDTTGNILNVNAQLGALADNGGPTLTHALLPGSPAINAGSNAKAVDQNNNPLATDQRGSRFGRIQSGTVDMGAVEFRPTITAADGALWYLGPPQSGSNLSVYREPPGQVPLWVDGGLAVELGQAGDGTILLRNSFGEIYARAGSASGIGTHYQLLTSVTAGDGAKWFLGPDGGGGNLTIYRWATGGSPMVSGGAGVELFTTSAGAVRTITSGGEEFERIGSATGFGTEWQLIFVEAPSLVVTTASDVVSTSDGLTSLREAIAYANSKAGPDTVSFDAGLAGGTITLGSQLTLTETGAGNRTTIVAPAGGITISGNDATRLFQVNTDVAATFDTLTYTNGYADQGGAIVNLGDLIVLGGVFRDNEADPALGGSGGIGGAISNLATLSVSDALFVLNTASGGGAIDSSGTLTVSNSTFSQNRALSLGGGLRNTGTATVSGSTFNNNRSGNAGGGLINQGNLTLTNSTITANEAVDGAGVHAASGSTQLRYTTVAGNTASGGGGGIVVNASTTATNTIIAGNTAANQNDVFGTLEASSSHNVLNQSAAAAGLGAFGDHGGPTPTVALVLGSPAINAGIDITGITTDQRGVLRPFGLGSDIGAVESQFPLPSIHPQDQTVDAGDTVTFAALADGLFSDVGPNTLSPGESLLPGEFLISPNKGYKLVYQTDSNLVLYRGDGLALWDSDTAGESAGRAEMQTDGNFVVYNADNTVLLQTETFGHPGAMLTLQSDGNLVVYDGAAPVFFTGFDTNTPNPIPTVQWQVSTNGGGSFADIPGATFLSHTFVAAQSDDGYQYRALFSNVHASSVPTDAATLTLAEVPSLVVTTLDDVVNNTDGLTSLREAILFANANPGADTITVAPGISGGTVTLSIAGTGEDAGLTGDLDITSEVTIEAAGTTIDANQIDRVLHVLDGGALTLNDATITGGSVVVNGTLGGGLLTQASATTIINRSSILRNFAVGRGGGIAAIGSLEINHSSITENRSRDFGGGVYVESTTLVANSTLSNNRADSGGGGGASVGGSGSLNVINSTLSGNITPNYFGGAIRLWSSSGRVSLTNSTIVGNSAWRGGGFSNDGGEFSVSNSIVTANTGTGGFPDVIGVFVSNGHNVIGDVSGNGSFGGGDDIGTPANQVVDLTLANNGGPTQTHALVYGLNNPAINSGASIPEINTDQRGVLRPFGAGVDIGAFESQFPLPSIHPQDQTVDAGDTVTFTALADGLFAGDAPIGLANGESLLPGEFLLSPNHGYKLEYQTDGNLVLYRGDGSILWNAGTGGTNPGQTEMQDDGNFVVYDAGENVVFQTVTFGHPGAELRLQDDGNLVIYDDGAPIFFTGLDANVPNPIPSVQWQVSTNGGASFADIPGATGLSHTFVAAQSDDGYQYRALFSNIHASNVPTDAATLTLAEVPGLVVTTLDDVVNNTDGLTSLREAILFANANPGADTITFAPGIAGRTVTLSIASGNEDAGRSGDLDITSEMTIEGASTTINGSDLDTVLHVHGSGKLTLNDATITGGYGSQGGAVRGEANSSTSINRSSLSGNRAHISGGGIYIASAAIDITDSTISGNSADVGGGVTIRSSTASITNSTFSGNAARNGGGIVVFDSTVNVLNTTISGNAASSSGGGMHTIMGNVALTSSTIVGNSSAIDSGGIYERSASFTVSNSIIIGNSAVVLVDASGTFTSNGRNVIGDVESVTGFGGGDDIGTPVDQVLVVDGDGKPLLANNGGTTLTHALVFGLNNPAINAGESIPGVNTDQRGVLRPFGAGVDIGAFESQFPLPSLNPQDQTVNAGDTVTFTALADGLFAGEAPSGLASEEPLLPGQFLLSPNHAYQLIYQTDGNLVLYRGDGVVVWNSGTFGQTSDRAEMQDDGNFVVYNADGSPVFFTDTFGNPGATLGLSDNGLLAIFDTSGGVIHTINPGTSAPTVVPTIQWQVSTDGGVNFTDIAGATNLSHSFVASLSDENNQYRAVFSNSEASNVPTAAATLSLFETPSLIVTITSDIVDPNDDQTSLREAILFANANPGVDTITFAPGIAGGTVTLSIAGTGEDAGLTGDLDITSEITINAAGTTIDANQIDRVLHVSEDGALTLNDATITGGSVDGSGGAIWIRGGAAFINRSTIGGNAASHQGGGISANDFFIPGGTGEEVTGLLELYDSTVIGNTAQAAGGGVAASGSALTISRSTISDNAASEGGGVYVFGREGHPGITDTLILGNHATETGGGVHLTAGTSLDLVSTLVAGNTAPDYAGILVLLNSVLDVVNSTISGNTASGVAGGIGTVSPGDVVNLTNSTVVGNSAGTGGGLYRGGGTFTVANSIVTANATTSGNPDVEGAFTSNGHNVIGDVGSSTGFGGGDDIGTPANQVVDLTLADNGGPTQTHALLYGLNNPAINAGAAIPGITTDQRGVLRPFGAGVDIGAVESQFPLPSIHPQDQTVTEGDTVTFTALADGLFAGDAASGLGSGESLLPGEFLLSPNHGYQLIYQNDGNLVLYRGDGVAVWSSGTFGQTTGRAEMQDDGNFVVYDAGGAAVFNTATSGNPGATLGLSDNGLLAIFDNSDGVIHTINTGTTGPTAVPTIQWQVSTDGGTSFTDLAGETNLTLSFTTALAATGNQYRARFTNAFASDVPTSPATLTVEPVAVAPTFIGAVINGADLFANADQHSQITSLVLNFDQAVTIDAGAFTLTNLGTTSNATPLTLSSDQIIVSGNGTSQITLRWAAGAGIVSRLGSGVLGNSLADGRWQLTIDSSKVTAGGLQMIGDNEFGDEAVDDFFRMFGDNDGDGDVDRLDYNAFFQSYLQTSASLLFDSAFDADGDGDVDQFDYLPFRRNYGRRLTF